MHVALHDLQAQAGSPITTEFVQECIDRDRAKQREYYLDACHQAGLDPGDASHTT